MTKIIIDGLSLSEELSLIKYEQAVFSASHPQLIELFMDLLRLKLARDVYFRQHLKMELGLDVPDPSNPGYSTSLGTSQQPDR